MRKAVLVGASLVALAQMMPVAGAGESAPRSGRYIVVLRNGDPAATAAEHASRHGGTVGHVYRHALSGYSITLPEAAASRLAEDSRVAYVAPDVPLETAAKPGGNSSTQPAQTSPTGVDRVDGAGQPTLARTAPVEADVVVMDTGVDPTHPDLNVMGGYNCTSNRTGDWKDYQNHGTHVAGTIGAKNNAIGVIGIAPGVRLYSARMMDKYGRGYLSYAVCAIDWVTAQRDADGGPKMESVNMSFSFKDGYSTEYRVDDGNCGRDVNDPMHLAICNSVASGVTYAAAAGNQKRDAVLGIPSSYDEVITVSALADSDGKAGGTGGPVTCSSGTNTTMDEDDTFANFSNFGADVDIISPGVCINSTVPGGGYAVFSGTSMATPLVAGAAALYQTVNPAADPAEVKLALTTTWSNLEWNNVDDRDAPKEPLLDVSVFYTTPTP